MPMDDGQRAWLARVEEHKALARLLREGRLVREDRVRYDALTRALLDELPRAGDVDSTLCPARRIPR